MIFRRLQFFTNHSFSNCVFNFNRTLRFSSAKDFTLQLTFLPIWNWREVTVTATFKYSRNTSINCKNLFQKLHKHLKHHCSPKLNFRNSSSYFSYVSLRRESTQLIYETNDLTLLARYKKLWSFVDENDENISKRYDALVVQRP